MSDNLTAEIKSVVEAAARGGHIVYTGQTAKQLAKRHADAGKTPREIAEIVAREAVAAGAPIQFTSPE